MYIKSSINPLADRRMAAWYYEWMTPRITIIGHVCIDDNDINGIKSTTWGSPLLYMADYFVNEHGFNPVLVAPYGYDLTKYINDGLLFNKPHRHKTLRYHNSVDGDVRVQLCSELLGVKPVSITRRLKRVLNKTDIFILAPLLPNYKERHLKRIEKYLPTHTLRVILPQGYFRDIKAEKIISKRNFDESAEILRHFDILIQSNEDIENSETVARGWSEQNPNLYTVVTLNRKGSITFSKGESLSLPTVAIDEAKIKNPIGAGDIFSASLSYHYYKSGDIKCSTINAHRDTRKFLVGDR